MTAMTSNTRSEMVQPQLRVNDRGLVDIPQYPCYKAEGYCRLRTIDTGKFQCIFQGKACRFRLVREGDDGSKKG